MSAKRRSARCSRAVSYVGSDRAGQVAVDISRASSTVLASKRSLNCLVGVCKLVDVRAIIPGPSESSPRWCVLALTTVSNAFGRCACLKMYPRQK